jgi:hypothetical protein
MGERVDSTSKACVKAAGNPPVEKAVKSANKGWPPHILAILGTWKDADFPDASELRKGYGKNIPREPID